MLMRVGDPDRDLIPGLKAGEESALRLLMSRRMETLHRLAFRLLGDRFEAEDVCQETFLKFWRAAPEWRTGEAKILTWLCRVATNDCYDRLRKHRPDLPGDLPEQVDQTQTAQDRLTQNEDWDRLQTAMMALPDRQRAALTLRYDQDMPQREAASILGISEKAYEALLVRGRKKLKTLMQESDHD
ncbi:MAG: sigma-70 family RNA polymerase sigma factor [Pseudomonadota bacterium]